MGGALGTATAFLIIFAVPLAMLSLIMWRIILPLVTRLLCHGYAAIDEQSKPKDTAHYSIVSLFSLAKIPYRLYPITHSLLE